MKKDLKEMLDEEFEDIINESRAEDAIETTIRTLKVVSRFLQNRLREIQKETIP